MVATEVCLPLPPGEPQSPVGRPMEDEFVSGDRQRSVRRDGAAASADRLISPGGCAILWRGRPLCRGMVRSGPLRRAATPADENGAAPPNPLSARGEGVRG
ncbi:MAG: hypothetical protein ACUVSB_04180 [Anaerolineae bacterium]